MKAGKRLLVLVLVLASVFMLTGCDGDDKEATSSIVLTKSGVTQSELNEAYKMFQKKMKKLKASKVEKIVLSSKNPTMDLQLPDVVSEDPELIEQWVDLLKSMKVYATKAHGSYGGRGYGLAFHMQGGEVLRWSFIDENIYYDIYTENGYRTQMVIENYFYDNLESEFNRLEKEMGFENP